MTREQWIDALTKAAAMTQDRANQMMVEARDYQRAAPVDALAGAMRALAKALQEQTR